MDNKIIFISGGQRSGKSLFAEQISLSLSSSPVYIATAQAFDEEMKQRIDLHRKRRGACWTNIEAPFSLPASGLDGRVVLLDCLTVFSTNWFLKCGDDPALAFKRITEEIDRLTSSEGSTFIFVTGEIGLGGISENPLQRRFTDLLGNVNQMIAAKADEAYMVISGLPLRLK